MNFKDTVKNMTSRKCNTITQKVALRLVKADGDWVSTKELQTISKSATSRVRDLRKEKCGGFTVDCVPAGKIGKTGDSWYYRMRPSKVSKKALTMVFGTLV